jgi:TonB family protein
MTTSTRLESLCLQDLDAAVPRFVRCVALPAGRLGLGLAADGTPAWQDEAAASCPIAVAADGRLALTRTERAPAVRVERAGRSVDVLPLRPTMLRDGDVLVVDGHRVRLFRHGEVARVHRPRLLRGKLAALAAAAALALAAGVAAPAGADAPIEVQPRPPAPPPPPPQSYRGVVKVDVGTKRGPGKVEPAKVKATLVQTLGPVTSCYDSLLGRGSRAAGTINLEFTLREAGRAEDVTIVKDGVGANELTACVLREVKARTFAPPTGGHVTLPVTYTFARQRKSGPGDL